MKLFTFLLSLYILLLSCIPCNDSSDCSVEDNVSVVLSDTHNDHDDDTEHCTPFCVCACCAAPAVHFQQAFVFKHFDVLITTKMPPADFIFSSVINNIWQPPRC